MRMTVATRAGRVVALLGWLGCAAWLAALLGWLRCLAGCLFTSPHFVYFWSVESRICNARLLIVCSHVNVLLCLFSVSNWL